MTPMQTALMWIGSGTVAAVVLVCGGLAIRLLMQLTLGAGWARWSRRRQVALCTLFVALLVVVDAVFDLAQTGRAQ